MPTNILDKTTGQTLTAAEFNIVKNLVDTNEIQAALGVSTSGTNATNITTNTNNISTNTANIALNATAAANALAKATFDGSTFRIFDNTDNTKQASFGLTAIGTGQVRQIIMPNADVDLANVRTEAEVVTAINSQLGGTGWQSGGSGSTDLTYTASTRVIASSSGGDATLTLANSTNPGLMSNTDFDKLSNIEANATADQTGEEIEALYEALPDTNKFTDALSTKLSQINTGAQLPAGGSVGQTIRKATANDYDFEFVDGLEVDVTLLDDGELLIYDAGNNRLTADNYAITDATAGDVGTIDCNSIKGGRYGYPNPHTIATVTISSSNVVNEGSAILRAQAAAKPTFSMSSFGTVIEVGSFADWDNSAVNHVGFVAVDEPGDPQIYVYYLGAEA